jgi:glutamine amidotransferase-like uncharacterized protein
MRPFLIVLLFFVALVGCLGPRDKNSIPLASENPAPILLFTGNGTSPGDVAATEAVLNDNHLVYSAANSSQLNAMDESQLRRHELLIVPGGNFIDIGNGLAPTTSANIHSAVQNGLNYLGLCAGAFFAGNSRFNGANLTSGVKFGFYSAENQGIRKAAVPIAAATGSTLDQYWEDGPQLTGWGAVVAKYPDGTPAVTEGNVGSGWVILSGIHPEAPDTWRRGMSFTTPAATDNAYAATLIQAALTRESLPHF